MNIGPTIKLFRKQRKLNQTKFGKLCGLSQTALSQIETGDAYPHQHTLLRICEVLNISELYLYLNSASDEELQEYLTISLNRHFNE